MVVLGTYVVQFSSDETIYLLNSNSILTMSVGNGDLEERTTTIVRWMNTIRIPLYLCVTWVQVNILTDDVGTVLVPLGLAFLDTVMVIWGNKRKTGLGLFALILSSLSLGIAVYSLQPFFYGFLTGWYSSHPLVIEELLMLNLGLMVALVSLVEIVALISESLKLKEKTSRPTFEIRTYEN